MENRVLNLLLLKGKCKNCPLDYFCNNEIEHYGKTVCEAIDENLEAKDDTELEKFLEK